ncbi:MAG: sugar-binding domain-containing protein [Anaerostipes sp.]|jgi:deoxyribonucleoside regulator|nr:sugar-binding domain-containing protein [Anaerostipes sp.]MDD3747430.1 sugar-binding domain-containing protein [Anaerostipes sp.]
MNKQDHWDSMNDKIMLVAKLYYENKLSQQEIANRLNISRPWVSKLLSKAEEQGIVQISIHSPYSGSPDLEQQLREKYGLTYAGVISNTDDAKDNLSLSVVNYFISQIQPEDIIGISWGNAVSKFVKALFPLHFPNTQVVPLAGSFGTTFDTLPNYNSMQLADTIGGKANLLHVPAFCSSQEEYDTLINNEQTQEILSLGEESDLIIVGIGSLAKSFMIENNILSDQDIKELKEADALGDVALQFLDSKGQQVQASFSKRLIKADIFKASKHARSVIAIAEGKAKVDMIHVALSLNLITAFFTDEETALLLLDK